MVILEILNKNVEINDDNLEILRENEVIEIGITTNPLLMESYVYRLNTNKLVERFISLAISQTNELERILRYKGLFNEYKILRIIEKYQVVSPKLIENSLPGISKSWLNRILNNLLKKEFIKKIEKDVKGLYVLTKKGEELIR
ncbi:MAG: hypothetical protein HWN67_08965 [Candidatus Helarchaeota archaeon]|nr:hypothetical protein [Candidatus Helarchaeota archaeon]